MTWKISKKYFDLQFILYAIVLLLQYPKMGYITLRLWTSWKEKNHEKRVFCWIVWSTFSLLKSPSQRYYLLSKHKQESKCTYQNLWDTAFRTIDKNKCVYVQKHRQAFPYLFRILQLSTVSLLVLHTQSIVAENSQKIPKILLMHNFFVLTNIRYKNFDIGV